MLLGPAGCLHFQTGPSQPIPENERLVVEGRGQIHVVDLNPAGAETILLVHGYGATIHSYEPILAELAKQFRVIALDLPGFGKSDRLEGDYSPMALAEVLVKVLDKKGIAQAHVVGNSWGASIALAFSLSHPDRLRKLIIISGFMYEEQLLPLFIWARVSGLGEALFATFYRQAIGERLYINFLDPQLVTQDLVDGVNKNMQREGTAAVALAAARGMRFSGYQDDYARIEADALLLWGREDRVTRLEFGERLSRQLHNSRLIVLSPCGHVLMWECRQDTLAALKSFLGVAR
jgi:pimeloyl-ACP methyl ester carboxylesterase